MKLRNSNHDDTIARAVAVGSSTSGSRSGSRR